MVGVTFSRGKSLLWWALHPWAKWFFTGIMTLLTAAAAQQDLKAPASTILFHAAVLAFLWTCCGTMHWAAMHLRRNPAWQAPAWLGSRDG
ncbi:MAG: hypothetical protein ABR562_07025 [Thermoplasmatota archaeon]